jgi:hypothetical protein
MSNHARRRVIRANQLFPKVTPASVHEARLTRQLMRATHEPVYIEIGERMGEVNCTCGFVQPAPFGEPQGEIIIEQHLAFFHVIPDPMGAKYRA